MLSSFVDEKSYDDFIKLLTSIHEDTLRETTSVLILKGGFSSGKTILTKIMQMLAPTTCRKEFGVIGIYGMFLEVRKKSVASWNSSLIVLSELSFDDYDGAVKKYHEIQKETGVISLYQIREFDVNFNPGVFLMCMIDNNDITKLKVRKRMPVELILPYKFKHDDKIYLTIVEDCVKEFMEIYRTS